MTKRFQRELTKVFSMPFRASVLTLYPEMFPGPLGVSLAGEGLRRGLWSLETHQIRDHGIGRHRNVDDNPAGGGAGMVLRCDVLGAAIDAAVPAGDTRPRLLMSPRGRPLAQRRRLARLRVRRRPRPRRQGMSATSRVRGADPVDRGRSRGGLERLGARDGDRAEQRDRGDEPAEAEGSEQRAPMSSRARSISA